MSDLTPNAKKFEESFTPETKPALSKASSYSSAHKTVTKWWSREKKKPKKARKGRLEGALNWIRQKTQFEFKADAIRKCVERGNAGVTPSKPGRRLSAQPSSPMIPIVNTSSSSSLFKSPPLCPTSILRNKSRRLPSCSPNASSPPAIADSSIRKRLRFNDHVEVPGEYQDATAAGEDVDSLSWNEDNEYDETLFLGQGTPPSRPCEGIIRDLKTNTRYFYGKKFRELATWIEKGEEDGQHIVDRLIENESLDTLNRLLSPEFKDQCLVIENHTIVLRSTSCSGVVSSTKTTNTRCTACKEGLPETSGRIAKAPPIGISKKPPPHTNHKHMARHPDSSQAHMARQSAENRRLKKEVIKLKYEKNLAIEGVNTTSEPVAEAVLKAFQEADKHMDQHFDADKDSDEKLLWEVALENMQTVAASGGKKTCGLRFNPMLLNFAIGTLAKSSQSVYRELAEVFHLPSLSYVLRKTKELAGEQSNTAFGICLETMATLKAEFDREGIPEDRRLGALAFDSVMIKKGLQWDLHQGLVGIDPSLSLEVVSSTFRSQAKKLAASTLEGDEATGNTPPDSSDSALEDSMENIAGHHMVWKYTTVDPDIKFSLVVAREDCESLKAARLEGTLMSLLLALFAYGLDVCSLCGDGATENVQLFKSLCTETILDWLSNDTKQEFEKLGLLEEAAMNVVFINPSTGKPIFVVEDMPHVVKRLANALELSSKKKEKRDLRFEKNRYPINLRMLEGVWQALGGGKFHLSECKLGWQHFLKDAYSRMNVSLAVQVLSDTVVIMITKAQDDPDIKLPMQNFQYDKLKELARHVNNLVDIINGRSTTKNVFRADFKAETAEDIQKKLIEILKWFSDWRALVFSDDNDLTEWNFLSEQTWNGLKRTILGYVGLLAFYVTTMKFSISPRRTLSDTVENHFAALRQGEASDGLTASKCRSGAVKSTSFQMTSNKTGKTNCRGAPGQESRKAFKRQKRF